MNDQERTFEVPIIYKGLVNFVVKAKSVEEAKAKALEMYGNSYEPTNLGNEFEYVDSIGDTSEINHVG